MKTEYFINFIFLITIFQVNAQSHNFGLKIGYAKSMISVPNNKVNIIGSEILIEEGDYWFKGIDGFQIGITSNFDIGNDFIHLDLNPQYSRYGFSYKNKKQLNYFDLEIGISNLNSEVTSKFIAGFGVIPSILISSKNIEIINDFDIKGYLIFGYKFYMNYIFYAQLKQGLLELIPDTKARNFQLSANINIPILKIKK